MANIISTDTSTILENFQTAYYSQIGKRMQIGSEEYTISAIFTYVLAIYTALINNSYKNQVISTASGEYLDNIAAKYNLSRTPERYSNPYFEGYFTFNNACEYYGKSYDVNELSLVVGEHTYYNSNKISSATHDTLIRFVCNEAHSDALSKSELINALKTLRDSEDILIFVSYYVNEATITELLSVSEELSDTDFRTYISNSKMLYSPGIAGSFEALAKASSPYIVDARVRVQGDTGFVPGNVDLYCKCYDLYSDRSYNSMIKTFDVPEVAKLITSKSMAVIGQTVNVYNAEGYVDTRQYTFYAPAAYNSSEYTTLYNYKFKAVCSYLNNNSLGINEPFMPSMVLNLMVKSLSEVSEDMTDYGFISTDAEYINFDKYKDLPVLGLNTISDLSKHDATPVRYIYLKNNTASFVYI